MLKYDIYYEDRVIGCAELNLAGLYYAVHCRCRLEHHGIYRVIVDSGTHRMNLGVCAPMNGEYVLTKNIPIKYLTDKKIKFYIRDSGGDASVAPQVIKKECISISKVRFMRLIGIDGERKFIYIDDENHHPVVI